MAVFSVVVCCLRCLLYTTDFGVTAWWPIELLHGGL